MSQPTCILCAYYHPRADPHAPEPGWQTCLIGSRRLEHDLLGIRAAYLRLDEEVAAEPGARDTISQLLPGAPTPSPSNQPRVAGSRERRLPIDAERLDLLLPVVPGYVRDPRHDQIGHHSVATLLNEWVAEWHDRWHYHESYPRTDAIHLIDWILAPTRLQRICQEAEALADFAEELRGLRSRLRYALGDVEKKPVIMWGVSCPRCQLVSQLRLDPEDPDNYRECGSCGLMLSRDEYLQHLRDLVDQHRQRGDVARG